MEPSVSERIENMAVSATLAMAAKAREMRGAGKDIIALSLGEPDFNIPDFIKEAAKDAIDADYSSYPPVDGFADLKEAIARKFERDNGLRYDKDQIVVSTGAKQSLFNVAMSVLDPGDEVVLPAPFWVSYSDIVKLAGGVPVVVPTTIGQDFKMTPNQLREALSPRTKMLWFSSPCNPSGSVYSREEFTALAAVLADRPDIVVVADEIYEHINYIGGHVSMASIPGMYERTVTVNGVSKAFAMTGWRIGYIGAPAKLAKACTKLQGQVTSGANVIAQRAVIAALDAPVSRIRFMIDAFRARRDMMLELLGDIPGLFTNVPDGAFYLFPDVSAYFGRTLGGKRIENASDLALYLLENAHVATVTGTAFGHPDSIRISYAASEEELREAVARIKKALNP